MFATNQSGFFSQRFLGFVLRWERTRARKCGGTLSRWTVGPGERPRTPVKSVVESTVKNIEIHINYSWDQAPIVRFRTLIFIRKIYKTGLIKWQYPRSKQSHRRNPAIDTRLEQRLQSAQDQLARWFLLSSNEIIAVPKTVFTKSVRTIDRACKTHDHKAYPFWNYREPSVNPPHSQRSFWKHFDWLFEALSAVEQIWFGGHLKDLPYKSTEGSSGLSISFFAFTEFM